MKVRRCLVLCVACAVTACQGPRSDVTQIADAIGDEAINLRWSDRTDAVVRLTPITTEAHLVAVVPIATTLSELRAAGIDESNAKQIIGFMDEHETNCIAVLAETTWEKITLHESTITIDRPMVVSKRAGDATEFVLKEGNMLEVKLIAIQ